MRPHADTHGWTGMEDSCVFGLVGAIICNYGVRLPVILLHFVVTALGCDAFVGRDVTAWDQNRPPPLFGR